MPSFGVIFVLELTNFGLFSLLFSARNTEGVTSKKPKGKFFLSKQSEVKKWGNFISDQLLNQFETYFFTAAVVVASEIGKV